VYYISRLACVFMRKSVLVCTLHLVFYSHIYIYSTRVWKALIEKMSVYIRVRTSQRACAISKAYNVIKERLHK